MKNLALIPVRTGSKRLKNKNILDFFGKPMFIHTVEAAMNSELFDEIHVSTESEDVVRICEKYNIEVRFLRSKNLASDSATLTSLCDYVIKTYKDEFKMYFENFCLLWATAPLRTSEDIIKSYNLLTEESSAVVSVTNYDLPVHCSQFENSDGYLEPNFPDMFWLSGKNITQNYCDNGALCWVKTDIFESEKTWLPKKTKPYFMKKNRSVDIDTEEDFNLAKYYYSHNIDHKQ